MVGAAIVDTLQAQGHSNIVTRTHAALDLTNQSTVNDFFETEHPDQVYLTAAKRSKIGAI
jgi:GDP-L-fucose synthase